MFAMLIVLPTVCYTYLLLFVFPMLYPILSLVAPFLIYYVSNTLL